MNGGWGHRFVARLVVAVVVEANFVDFLSDAGGSLVRCQSGIVEWGMGGSCWFSLHVSLTKPALKLGVRSLLGFVERFGSNSLKLLIRLRSSLLRLRKSGQDGFALGGVRAGRSLDSEVSRLADGLDVGVLDHGDSASSGHCTSASHPAAMFTQISHTLAVRADV
jgi:hypothetical protein